MRLGRWTWPGLAVCIVALLSLTGATSPPVPLPAAAEAGRESIALSNLRAHLRFLASDALRGRQVGAPGNHIASLYVATTLEALGLHPATSGFDQTFGLVSPSLGPENRLALKGTGANEPLGVGSDFYPAWFSATGQAAAPVVFAGYGISAPELGYDDFEGLDVAGRIVLVLRHAPEEKGDAARRWAPYRDHRTKVRTARARGAAAVLIAPDLAHHDAEPPEEAWRQVWPDAAHPRLVLEENHRVEELPVAMISADTAGRLLSPATGAAGQHPIAAQQARIARSLEAPAPGKASPRALGFDTGAVAELAVDIRRERIASRNVLAVLPGTEPDLRREVVVVGAHVDHDGVDEADRVFNGADDDASGLAALLAIAEGLSEAARRGAGLRRTVLFAAWNAEEIGSLGSRYFVRHPLPEGSTPVANLNLDMIGRREEVPDPSDARFRGLKKTSASESANTLHVIGYSYSPGLLDVIERANARANLTLRAEYDRHPQDLLRRSDHWPFLERGIPAIFFTTGLHPDYHTPDDDVEKIDFSKLERITRLVYDVTWQLAMQDSRPAFVRPTPDGIPAP